jgi:hypothetical protein
VVELLSSFWNTRWLAAPLPEQRRAPARRGLAVSHGCRRSGGKRVRGAERRGRREHSRRASAARALRLLRGGIAGTTLDTEQPLTEPVVVSARSFAEAARGTENGSAPRPLRDYEIFAGTGRSAGAAGRRNFSRRGTCRRQCTGGSRRLRALGHAPARRSGRLPRIRPASAPDSRMALRRPRGLPGPRPTSLDPERKRDPLARDGGARRRRGAELHAGRLPIRSSWRKRCCAMLRH